MNTTNMAMPVSGPRAAGAAPTSLLRPRLMRIHAAWDETPDVRTLQVVPADGGVLPAWQPGQFAEWSVFGAGEAVFTLANSPTRGDVLECSYRAIGKVTHALRHVGVGQVIGFRGPYGNTFDTEAWKGHSVVFVGGGIGTVALRAAVQYVLDRRDDYGEVIILNGARTVADLCYQREMPDWAKSPDARVVRAVDPGGETRDWDGEVGLIPAVFEKMALDPHGRVVVACGPPIMLKYLFMSLRKLGFSPAQVVTTLENKMKCGIGMCGRCNVGRHYVCVDGPVFTWEQLEALPSDF
jgi:NAD(P)H-flavin reductase